MLLACRQWDPRGLARRLPSLGAGARRGAPLLPWRVQLPGCVCAALAAGWGGLGRCRVSCLPRFLLPAPRFLRCVWRAVPSGCPLSSLPGTPFHAVCAFSGLGPVALLISPPCPLRVCALALPRRPRPPAPLPWLVWRAHLARSQCWALVGPFHAVRAPPRVLPRFRAPFGLLGGGGGGPVAFPPYLALGCVLPVGRVWASGAFQRRGLGWGGGRPVRRSPRLRGRAGQWGGGSPCLCPSLWLLWAGNKAGVLGVPLAMEGVAPIPLRFVLACCLRARSVWRPCVLARVCLSIAVPAGAGGWGVEAGPAPASLPGAAVLPGGVGIIPSASGGVGGRHPRGLRVGRGGWGDRGGSRRGSRPPPSGGGAVCGPLPCPPFVARASPPGVRVRSGSWGSPGRRGRPAAGGPALRGGGGRGGP